jgi:hypothetical protein
MSAALFLNPNLTTDQAIELSRLQTQGFCELCDQLTASTELIAKEHGKEAALKYFNEMYPIIIQQMVLYF